MICYILLNFRLGLATDTHDFTYVNLITGYQNSLVHIAICFNLELPNYFCYIESIVLGYLF